MGNNGYFIWNNTSSSLGGVLNLSRNKVGLVMNNAPLSKLDKIRKSTKGLGRNMNQSSKSELDKILTDNFEIKGAINSVHQPEEAKQQLLQLALSCLPDKKEVPKGDNAWDIRIGKYTTEDIEHKIIQFTTYNAAIDTIEANIRAEFNG